MDNVDWEIPDKQESRDLEFVYDRKKVGFTKSNLNKRVSKRRKKNKLSKQARKRNR